MSQPDVPRAALAGILLATVLAWAWIAPMARDMYGPMTGLSAWMMSSDWDARRLFLLWLMWAVMMAAMMLPSALPVLRLYAGALAQRDAPARAMPVYAMTAGYLMAWAAFSLGATALQRLLSHWLLLNPMMEMTSRAAIGATLVLAGLYQLTPWKRACLSACRSPFSMLTRRWRRGLAGAFRMGLEHGAYCLGCCWALMLLLFAGGVMNLTVIVGLTAVVLAEKVLPFGEHVRVAVGAALLVAGAWMLAG